MNFRFIVLIIALLSTANLFSVNAQVNPVIGQISASFQDTYVRDISGDGRFVVMESTGNIATVNPRNTDNNSEIFLFDYAQRQIFQITNTKSLLKTATGTTSFDNIKVDIYSTRPTLSNNGRWIAFSSNATTSTPTAPNTTNPGSFIAADYTDTNGNNPLTADANTEIWLYQIPSTTSVDLSSGLAVPFTDLSAGTFTRVTNTPASRLPAEGTSTSAPIIADDNRDVSIDDTGNTLAFISTRDIVTGGNSFPNDDNPEVYTYKRTSAAFAQITQTPRGNILEPIFNASPSIAGNGLRVAFVGNADNPIVGMTGGTNSDKNEEIFYADLAATGSPVGTKKQVTATSAAEAQFTLNFFNYGKRLSRNGRYIAFDSAADLTNVNGGTNFTAIATFVYDTTITTGNAFRQIAPRGDADSAAPEGDVFRFPTFSDYDGSGQPSTLVLATRLNIKADGTVPLTASEGLNNIAGRPSQVYTYTFSQPATSATFKRVTRNQAAAFIISSTQPFPANTSNRFSFNLAQT
ncbi:MAG: hypothetical protein MUC29_14895, partial [Pyrinomonadaceae bacterium]|nr:hypothetical protein [Pyrinomonadaceae bacterium]